MSDLFAKVVPGDALRIPAEFYNAVVDCVRAYMQKRGDFKASDIAVPKKLEFSIKNVSGADLDQYSVVGIGSKLVGPRSKNGTPYGRAYFESADPSPSLPFAVTQDPAVDDEYAPIIGSGFTFALVELSDVAHDYAAPEAGTYTHLVSQSSVGPARIIEFDGQDGTQLNGGINNSVTNITVDDGSAMPDVPFVVTIDTEDLNVTAVQGATQLDGAIDAAATSLVVDSSAQFPTATPFVVVIGTERLNVTGIAGLTWTVTRGYGNSTAQAHADNAPVTALADTYWTVTRGHNSTAAASHADNAAVTLKSGTVWALVCIDSQGSSTGLTEIIVYTNGTFTVPAVGSTVSVTVDTVSTAAWMVINGTVLVTDGTHIVQGTITAIASATAFTLRTEYILGGSSGQTMADNAKVIISTAMADASASRRGAVNTTAQTFAGGKTFNDGVQSFLTSNLTAYPRSTFSGASYGTSAAAMYSEQSSTVWIEGSVVWENLYTAGNPPMFMIRVPGAAGATLDPVFSLLDKSGAGPYYGAWATVSGMVFKGGLYISGSFSGTAASVGLGNVENTALSTWDGTANIEVVGTLSSGTWQATAIDDAYIASAATWNATSSNTSGTNSGDQTAATTPYTPSVSADWNGADPTNVADALDRCAALLATLNGGTGP